MRKELFLAIIIGAIIGLGTMFVFEGKKRGWLTGALPDQPTTAHPKNTPAPSPQIEKEQLSLTIFEPEDESVSTQEKITIKGQAGALTTIVVIWEQGEDILVADQEGFFETEIELSAGPNEIEISAYNENDEIAKKILTITYSTAKF